MRVRELEERLLAMLPASTAEDWDRTGMLVGDPEAVVSHVAVSLDPTIEAIDFAVKHQANVLVTHHPLFLQPPEEVKPAGRGADAVGSRIWQAVKQGVSVLSFHTALDANPRASAVLAGPLGFDLLGKILQETPGHAGFGYGQLCRIKKDGRGDSRESMSAVVLRDACALAFGGNPRLWGDEDRVVRSACLWTGASGDAPIECARRGIDALICGEVRYHTALDAISSGICIVELGHDVSEQPHCHVLVKCLNEAGIPDDCIHLMPLPGYWR